MTSVDVSAIVDRVFDAYENVSADVRLHHAIVEAQAVPTMMATVAEVAKAISADQTPTLTFPLDGLTQAGHVKWLQAFGAAAVQAVAQLALDAAEATGRGVDDVLADHAQLAKTAPFAGTLHYVSPVYTVLKTVHRNELNLVTHVTEE